MRRTDRKKSMLTSSMMRLSHEEGKAIKNSDLHGVQIAVFVYSLTSPLQERSDAKAHAHTLLHA